MGSLVETLTVVLAPGGVAAVLAGAVVSWARSQRSDVRVTLRREDGAQAEVVATQLRGLKASALPGVVAGLQRWLDGSPQAGSPAAVDAATADDRESRDDGPVDDSR